MSVPFSLLMQAEAGWRVQLDQFEGPLALLLHLIKRQKLDILDIPISLVAQQYIAHLNAMQPLDPEIAADYLWMAATLLRLKAEMLLPEDPEQPEDEEDPREALVERLLQYQRFKEAALAMGDLADARGGYYRLTPRLSESRRRPLYTQPVGQAKARDLAAALTGLLRRQRARPAQKPPNPIQRRELSVEQRTDQLRGMLRVRPRVSFRELCRDVSDRSGWVVTFLAILELVRRQEAYVQQTERFGSMLINMRDATEPALGDYVDGRDPRGLGGRARGGGETS